MDTIPDWAALPGEDSGDNSPSLTASTGKNDSSSPWGGILNALQVGTAGAGTILGALNGTKKPASKKSTTPTWLPLAIGGAVLLVVVLLVVRK